MEEKGTKRHGGLRTSDDRWLVLTECTGDGKTGYIHSCGETIMAAKVCHPIMEGSFVFSGKYRYEYVPYCPKCEEKPDFRGDTVDY